MQTLIRWLAATAAMVACAAVCVAGEAAVGQLVNPGFEVDADRDGIPDGWLRDVRAKPRWAGIDTNVRKEGRCSLRFEAGQTPRFDNVGQVVRVEPGALYHLSVWIRTRELVIAEGTVIAGAVAAVAVPHYAIIERGKDHAGSADWVEETIGFMGPKSGRVGITCNLANWGGASGTVWFDDIRLTRVGAPGAVRALPARPLGVRPLVAWALARTPPDWEAVLEAIASYYSGRHPRHLEDEYAEISTYLTEFRAAAQKDPGIRQMLVALYGGQAWRMPTKAVAAEPVHQLLLDAFDETKGGTLPKEADRAVRVGLARVTALQAAEPAAAVKAIQRTIGREANARIQLRAVLMRDVDYLRRTDQNERAAWVCEVALALSDPEAAHRPSMELTRLQALLAAGKVDLATPAAEKLAAAERKVPGGIRREALLSLVRLGLDAGDDAKVREWQASAVKRLAKERVHLAGFHLGCARAWADRERWEAAAAACQKLVASFPDQVLACFEAQRLLVRACTMQQDHDRALAAAKVLYAVAPNSEKEITEAVNVIMQTLKARYRSIALANDFVAFQSSGPAGKDGEKGTDDDVQNPLAAIQWKPSADAEALYQRTLAGLKADFAGRRWRGYLYLYWGKPALALEEFVRRYDEAPLEQTAIDEAIDDLVVALKGNCGHTLAGERFMAYQKLGPKGKDGQLGTADDLEDPLRELLKPQQ